MITLKFSRFPKFPLSVTFYEGIDDMPIENFQAFNKYLAIGSGIGSTFEEIDANHLSTLYAIADDKEKVYKAVDNLRILVNSIVSGVDSNHLAYCCLIHSIDGKPNDDLSEGHLKEVIKILSKAGITDEEVKKKLQSKGRLFLIQ
jgi:hypothetical protein